MTLGTSYLEEAKLLKEGHEILHKAFNYRHRFEYSLRAIKEIVNALAYSDSCYFSEKETLLVDSILPYFKFLISFNYSRDVSFLFSASVEDEFSTNYCGITLRDMQERLLGLKEKAIKDLREVVHHNLIRIKSTKDIVERTFFEMIREEISNRCYKNEKYVCSS